MDESIAASDVIATYEWAIEVLHTHAHTHTHTIMNTDSAAIYIYICTYIQHV